MGLKEEPTAGLSFSGGPGRLIPAMLPSTMTPTPYTPPFVNVRTSKQEIGSPNPIVAKEVTAEITTTRATAKNFFLDNFKPVGFCIGVVSSLPSGNSKSSQESFLALC
jgi:hypothetical protein